MSLVITNQEIVDRNMSVIEPAAWRVATIVAAEKCLALPLNFNRERDAERARAALQKAGLESEEALRRVGQGAVIRIMAESLAW
jgi:hypothetical protein